MSLDSVILMCEIDTYKHRDAVVKGVPVAYLSTNIYENVDVVL